MRINNHSLRNLIFLFTFTSICTAVFAENPIITQRYTADPNAFIFNDRLYVICSSDEDQTNSYDLMNYTLISTDDMANWTDHNLVFKVKSNTTWAGQAYAPTAITRNGKVYLCFPNGASSLGMCVADRPEGPYKDLLGKPLIDRNTPNCGESGMQWLFDPCLFVDSTATGTQAYVVFGGGTPYGSNFRIVKLNDDMKSISGTPLTLKAQNSFEGPFLHKYNNRYYLSYPTSGASNIDYVTTDDPMTEWKYVGTVLPNPSLDGTNINLGNNSHESMIEYKGQWYMFYHDRRISNDVYKRNASCDILKYNTDGTLQKVIVTKDGPAQIKKLYPYDTIQAETIWKQKGIETEFCDEGGVMVTNIAAGEYTSLKGVDFGEGAKSFEVRASSANSGGTVEVHLESESGTLAASCEITTTGSWTKWNTFSATATGCTGVKNVYFVYKGTGEPFRLNWFRFVPEAVGISKNSNQIKVVNESRSPCSYAATGSNNLPDGITYDLTGRILSGNQLKNSLLTKKSSMGVFIIRKK